MAIFFDSGRKDRSDIDNAMRAGDGALNLVVVLLLIAFALGSWYLYGSVRPDMDNTNPSLLTQPAPSLNNTAPQSPSTAKEGQATQPSSAR
jgi:hypothetical protein